MVNNKSCPGARTEYTYRISGKEVMNDNEYCHRLCGRMVDVIKWQSTSRFPKFSCCFPSFLYLETSGSVLNDFQLQSVNYIVCHTNGNLIPFF
jgi:hypothetical protein